MTTSATMTYEALDARTDRAATLLVSAGVGPGDRVVVQLRNRPEFVELIVAIAKVGAVLVPVSYFDRDEQVRHIATDAAARLVVAEPDLAACDAGPDLGIETIVVDESTHGYGARVDAADAHRPARDRRPDDTLYIGYTSGSTATPKGVVKDHRSVTQLATALATEWGLRRGLAELVSMPMCHSGGLWQAMFNLVLGGTIALNRGPSFDPEATLELLDRWAIDWTILVPTMSDALAEAARQPLPNVRAVVSGSAPLFTRTKERLLDLFPGAELNECYGATETGVVTNLGHRDQLRKQRCVGVPILGADIKVVDQTGTDVPPGTPGELAARSPYVMRCYHNLPERTADAVDRDGFVRVGDIATADDEGYIYIVDRKQDLIISGGLNVYPAEVEEVLRSHPAVLDAVVVGLSHEHWGEQVTAAVVVHDPISTDALVDHCRSVLPAYKVPKSVEYLETLPTLVSGKNARRLVRDQLAARAINT